MKTLGPAASEPGPIVSKIPACSKSSHRSLSFVQWGYVSMLDIETRREVRRLRYVPGVDDFVHYHC